MEINKIVELVKIELEKNKIKRKVPIEASGRHIHLSKEHIEQLFGEGYELEKIKDLSQTGQYACKERVRVIGKKGIIENVIVLGPSRESSQLEISITDSRVLGVKPIMRNSGDIKNTPSVIISNGDKIVKLEEGVIVAKNHIHMNEEDSVRLGVRDKELVNVRVRTERPVIFEDVLVRVNKNFVLSMHIDYDEGNCCKLDKGTYGEII